jgi:Na+/proline symporter
VAFGLYWKRANIVGAYCSIAFGAVAPIAFLILDQFKSSLPDSLSFLVDVNISGFLSFLLAVSGMILGSLVSQRTHPPIALEAKNRDGATR